MMRRLPALAIVLALVACEESPGPSIYTPPAAPSPTTSTQDCPRDAVELVDWWHESETGAHDPYVIWNATFAAPNAQAPCAYEVWVGYVVRQRGQEVYRNSLHTSVDWNTRQRDLCVQVCGPAILRYHERYEIAFKWITCPLFGCDRSDVQFP